MADANRRLRLGMVGGGEGAFIGAVHRIAARLDDHYELVAGAFSSDSARGNRSAQALHVAPDRSYADFEVMARAEAARDDGIDVVAIVTPNHLHVPIAEAFLNAGIHVICDKPLTTDLALAKDLGALVKKTGLFFGLTHNYTGYPLIRQAREMVQSGVLGQIRLTQMEYVQQWLTEDLENYDNKQAVWRTDPKQSGPAGCVGDIGTHVYNMMRFITQLEVDEISADLTVFVPGRRLDDNAHMMLRYKGGARGALWSSQVAPGNENGLSIRIYGTKGGIAWSQEHPTILRHSPLNAPPRILTPGGPELGPSALAASRIPAGHPEGYLEGFAQLYSDFAGLIRAHMAGDATAEESRLAPGIEDGIDGVRFISRAVESSTKNAAWVKFAD